MLKLHLVYILAAVIGTSSLAGASNVRLKNGKDSCSGRVEIYLEGQWGTVCDDDWDMKDTEVLCRQLGCGGPFSFHYNAHYGKGTDKIWLSNVNCTGTERTITECSYIKSGSHNCEHNEDVGVVCPGGSNLHLVNGGDPCSGREEIYHDGQWGTVCDDNWDLKDAEVVCRQLGCSRAVSAHNQAHFGQGSDPILLHDVRCTGSEKDIKECSYGPGSPSCNHNADVGVTCSGRNEVRLAGSTESCCGRVEIQHKGRWGTVCDRSWDLKDAEVVCRQFGCGRAVSAPRGAQFGRGSGPMWLDEVQCTGSESLINQCSHRGFGEENCGHDEDAGVVCLKNVGAPMFTRISFYSTVSPGESVQFRCTAPGMACIPVDFRLYKSSTLLIKQTVKSTTLFIVTVDSSHQGQYSCDYSYGNVNSTSPRSSYITITVVNLQKPRITFSDVNDTPNLSPEEREATGGHNFSVICSTEPQYPGGIFHLELTGTNITGTQLAVNHSAVFRFPKVRHGSYRCSYEVNVFSRVFTSTVERAMKESLDVFILPGVAAGTFLILLLIIICFVKNRRRNKNTNKTPQDENELDEVHDYEAVNAFSDQTLNLDDFQPGKHDLVFMPNEARRELEIIKKSTNLWSNQRCQNWTQSFYTGYSCLALSVPQWN